MRRYEGLFILNTAGQDEGVKEAIDKIVADIGGLGGVVETVQKMDRRTFARARTKKHTAGFYVNIIFRCKPEVLDQLRNRFALREEIFRVMFTNAPAPRPAADAVPAQA
ncbi:MAG: 30S ribosomal protein S6 [Verrucomicrobiae bacterium]|nr:30S ribosomal protein S6 [Verrucomicrobiae bacterium]MCX7722960.1 30S ribosomal protein S6 [Verrucomicrobiae bacterium]MDW7980431.1 30S ribosomal protein S6 [Verrucomicrobiales bacterium]